jgi:1-acyl-sn-glycerol-3-phosphate acyltransferase
MGWRLAGEFPDVPRMVIIVVPHTSNWDFIIGLAAKLALGLRASWLGKHTLFRPPFGWAFSAIGGIPVVRSASQDLVSQSIAAIRSQERVVLALAPEGTRRPVPEWRTGFWYIAHGAGVPIVPVALDWESRTMRIGPAFETGTDAMSDIAELRRRHAGLGGRRKDG